MCMVAAQDGYSIRRLTAAPLAHGSAYDIDNHFDVVGELLDGAGLPHPVVWRNGVAHPLPMLPNGTQGSARTITPGRIGGTSADANSPAVAVVWTEDQPGVWQVHKLGTAGNDLFGVVLGGTAGGPAVGYSDNGVDTRPAAWLEATVPQSLVVLPMPAWSFAGIATCVDPFGRIIGTVGDFVFAQPAVWSIAQDGAALQLLPTLVGWGVANDVNDQGLIAGAAAAATGYVHMASWQNGAISDLDHLPGTDCYAEAVNHGGDVVGWARTFTFPRYVATRKLANQPVVDLNTLLPAQTGWQVARAEGLNDAGAIVGTGSLNGFIEPFLLTPIHVRLAEPAQRVAGTSTKFELHGATVGATACLCASLLAGEAVVPGCLQGLDIANPVVVATATTAANGLAILALDVPAAAANQTLLFQAYDHAGCATSNVVPVTFQ